MSTTIKKGAQVYYHRAAGDSDVATVSRVHEGGERADLHVMREHEYYPVEFKKDVPLSDKAIPGTFTLTDLEQQPATEASADEHPKHGKHGARK